MVRTDVLELLVMEFLRLRSAVMRIAGCRKATARLTKEKPESVDTNRYAYWRRHRSRYTSNDARCLGPSFSLLQTITGNHGGNDHAKNQCHEERHEKEEKPWWWVGVAGHRKDKNHRAAE